MATAIFDTVIETPKNEANKYNLNVVIKTTGLDTKNLSYILTPKTGVKLENSILEISKDIYGEIEILVSDKNNSATARTNLSGFYAETVKTLNTEGYQKAVTNIRNQWTSIVS